MPVFINKLLCAIFEIVAFEAEKKIGITNDSIQKC